jgi:hypothetical protein
MEKEKSYAELELDILCKTAKENDRPVVEEFIPEILSVVNKFRNSGQSGGSAPFTAAIVADCIKKLCLHQPISPITGIDEEWSAEDGFGYQNIRCSALFKESKDSKPYYLDAIVWQGEDKYDTFTGTIEGIRSRQSIKSFPWTPKTFYIDVYRVPYDKEKHNTNDAVSCGTGDFVYFIKDKKQLDQVFEYYDKFVETLKA